MKGKSVIITGAGRGIGKAAALMFAEAGARLTLAARSEAELHNVAAEANRLGGDAIAVATDISDPAAVENLYNNALEKFDRVDILVNNAGMLEPFGMTEETDISRWQQCIMVNLFGYYLCCRAVLPEMRRRGNGRIISVSSGVAVKNIAGLGAYNASKAAVERFCGTLAEEVKNSDIEITLLRPGKVATQMQVDIRATPERKLPAVAKWHQAYQDGELLDPRVPAAAIFWMAGDFGGNRNGETFVVTEQDFQRRVAGDLGITLPGIDVRD